MKDALDLIRSQIRTIQMYVLQSGYRLHQPPPRDQGQIGKLDIQLSQFEVLTVSNLVEDALDLVRSKIVIKDMKLCQFEVLTVCNLV